MKKNIGGVWLPETEQHMIEVITGPKQIDIDGVVTYQYRKLQRAMQCVPKDRRRHCIDIGGHVGTWSMHLVKLFNHVTAFEPVKLHADIFPHNVRADNVTLHTMALGAGPGRVAMRENPVSTGSAHVWGDGDIEMRALDSFGFTEVDFIKIDVEGYELHVVRGAEQTIRTNRPIMVVEQKGRDAITYKESRRDLAVEWLQDELGMKRIDVISGDWILGW